jgi:hypothetical protein
LRKCVSIKLLEVSLSCIHFPSCSLREKSSLCFVVTKWGEPWETWRRFHWVILETLNIHCEIHLKCSFADILLISFIFNFTFMCSTCIIVVDLIFVDLLSIHCVILETLSTHGVMIMHTLSTPKWCYF